MYHLFTVLSNLVMVKMISVVTGGCYLGIQCTQYLHYTDTVSGRQYLLLLCVFGPCSDVCFMTLAVLSLVRLSDSRRITVRHKP